MNELSTKLRASHVNTGTSLERAALGRPSNGGRVLAAPRQHLERDDRAPVTPFGGVTLLAALWRRLDAAEIVDERVDVLRRKNPYHVSDHVFAHALNLYVGGDCIEDLAVLQHDPAMLRMLGATRLPDPTTAGDFLRRLDDTLNPGALSWLREAIDVVQDRTWSEIRRGRPGAIKRLGPWGLIDLDSRICEVHGRQKEGADFSYNRKWSFHPLIVTLANTSEGAITKSCGRG